MFDMLRGLGVKSVKDLVLFLVVLTYALAVLVLMIGAAARDFGLISFATGNGRTILLDLTPLTIVLSLVVFSFAIMWLAFGFLSIGFRATSLDPDSIEIRSPFVSVLIPAHNEERVVKDLVQDLLAQDYPHLEIVVVAHNCSDRTAQTLASIHNPKLRVFELRTKDSGKALALNLGLARARGDLIAQFDADNRVHDRRLIRRAVAYFITEPIDAIQARIETKNEGTNLLTHLQAVEFRIFSHLFWAGRNVLKLPSPLGGTGTFFRRNVLDRVGGWENELIEDYDMYCKLVRADRTIAYKPDLVTWDEKPSTWRTLLTQRSRWHRGHVSVLRKRWRHWMGVSDMMYIATPIANGAWLAATLVILLYYTLPWGFSYWYPPAVLCLGLWAASYATMAAILIRTGHGADVRYLPAFYVFGFHWLIAFLLAARVRDWSSTKTPHGEPDLANEFNLETRRTGT